MLIQSGFILIIVPLLAFIQMLKVISNAIGLIMNILLLILWPPVKIWSGKQKKKLNYKP